MSHTKPPFDILSLRDPASATELERAIYDSPLVHAVMTIGRTQGWNDLDILRTCVVLLANYSAALLDRVTQQFQEAPPAKVLHIYDEDGRVVQALRLSESHPFIQLARAVTDAGKGATANEDSSSD